MREAVSRSSAVAVLNFFAAGQHPAARKPAMTEAAGKKHSGAYSIVISLIVAIGGFLLGFDSSVISGATPFYKRVFELPEGSLLIGFSVSSIIFGAMLGNFVAGWFADRFGRKRVLLATALLFGFCAVGCALANGVGFFIFARIVGGLGIGVAILVAPMYIAEIAPPAKRGFLVTFNQLNIVIGISVAYFSNYFVLQLVQDTSSNWRVMLGVGTLPALAYLLLLFVIPESPRWLVQRGRDQQALAIMKRVGGEAHAESEYQQIKKSLTQHAAGEGPAFGELVGRRMRFVMFIGLAIAFFQQVSGINAILYYATMIFEMAGGGKEAAFQQAVILGLVNFGMTIVSMFLIDRIGRKPLLVIGSLLMAGSLLTASYAFHEARYLLTSDAIAKTAAALADPKDAAAMSAVLGKVADQPFSDETAFFGRIKEETVKAVRVEVEGVLAQGSASPGLAAAVQKIVPDLSEMRYSTYKDRILKTSITVNATLVLVALLGFIAGFAISLGPVMWALPSEIFPNRLRALAISIVGTWNSVVSFSVATVFPTQLERLGSGATYLIYGLFMVACLFFVLKWIPETKGKTLEEIERELVGA